jgi:hypothetical protein
MNELTTDLSELELAREKREITQGLGSGYLRASHSFPFTHSFVE